MGRFSRTGSGRPSDDSRRERAETLNALAEDLKVAFNTVRHWLDALERLYLVFTVAPWTRSVARATQKARKLSLVDYGLVEYRAVRFENMVALELLRAVTLWNDLGLGPFGLHFVRNKEKEEADVLIAEKRRPRLLVETKAAETRIDPALRKLQDQLGVPAVHLLDSGTTLQEDLQRRPLHRHRPGGHVAHAPSTLRRVGSIATSRSAP